MERAFLEAVEDIKSEIVLREIVERLERRDIEGAIEALHIDEAAFRPLAEALRQAFNQGGALVIQNMPMLRDPLGGRVVLRWSGDTQRAEAIIREQSSALISGVTESVKDAAREKIADGFAKGQGSQHITLELVGRVSRVTGLRTGGILGLTPALARTVENARTALLGGDIDGMRHYLTLTRRDKRFDRTVRKALRDGTPITPDMVSKITGRLADSYVKLRGLHISKTETGRSVNSAQHEAYWQGLEKANRDPGLVTRKWRSASDRRVRHTHMVLNAQEVTGMDMPFQSPSGALMRYPGDDSLGAGANELIGCRCICQYDFDFAEAFARSRGR